MRRHALCTILAASVFAACGGSDDDGSKAGTTARSAEDSQLAFARCMREQGIDLPDPNPGEEGVTRFELEDGVTPQKMQAAQSTCREKTGGGPREPSEAEQTEFRDAALKFTRCMREHGVELPDPQANGGGIVVRGDKRGPDFESPAFKKAQQECRDLLPRPTGGGTAQEVSP